MTAEDRGISALHRRAGRRAALLAMLASLLPGCDGGEGGQDADGGRGDAPVWGDAPRLVEELRLGRVEGEGPEVFSQVVGVAVDDDGGIWVGDRYNHEIRHFDRRGVYQASVGREGEGPGEFSEWLTAVVRFPDGRIGGWDFLRRTLVVFDGFDVRKAIVLERATPFRIDPQIHVDGRGFIYVRSRPSEGRMHWLKHTEDGALVDSLPIPPARPDGGGLGTGQLYAMGAMAMYPRQTMSYLSPRGELVQARTDEYEFRLPVDGGVAVVRRSWEPVPVKDGERASVQALKDHAAEVGAAVPEGTVPDSKPPWWRFWIDEEERLWVARHSEGFHEEAGDRGESSGDRPDWARAVPRAPPREWWEPLRFDVFDREGRFLGQVEFPNRQTRLEAARGRTVWVVEKGPLEEHYVVRYRVEGG